MQRKYRLDAIDYCTDLQKFLVLKNFEKHVKTHVRKTPKRAIEGHCGHLNVNDFSIKF